MPQAITKLNFESEVLNSTVPVLVNFSAGWCGPCKMLAPMLEDLSQDQELSGVKIVKLDIDECVEVATEYFIRSVPTIKMFVGGIVVDTKIGLLSKEVLKDWILAASKKTSAEIVS